MVALKGLPKCGDGALYNHHCCSSEGIFLVYTPITRGSVHGFRLRCYVRTTVRDHPRETLNVERRVQDPRYFVIGRDGLPDSQPVARLCVVLSLEISVKTGDKTALILRLHSYPPVLNGRTTMLGNAEGYWSCPNLQFPLDLTESVYSEDEILGRFEDNLRQREQEYERAVKRLAESFGIRDVDLVSRGDLLEVKPSNNDPTNINAYYTLRYGLKRAAKESYYNLTDIEGRHGFVYLPVWNKEYPREMFDADPNGTGSMCLRYLGKPAISGLTRILEEYQSRRRIIAEAINVADTPFQRRSRGIICAADVAGYGTALAEQLILLHTSQDAHREQFRRNVFENLEAVLSSLNTLEIQTAGDGFIAALPEWKYRGTETDALNEFLRQWTTAVSRIENEINKGVTSPSARVGSRIALLAGEYTWGRINGIASFMSTFDGEHVVKTARLEQGLSRLIAEGTAEHGGKTIRLSKRGHYAAIDSAAIDSVDEITSPGFSHGGKWRYLGRHPLRSKEYNPKPSEYSHVFEWTPRVADSEITVIDQ
ncbi:MAG TPA: hypothetical protein VIW24_08525 [Aldersonia sp.]